VKKPNKREEQRQRTRRAILDAGCALMARQGYDGTNVGQIARQVGVAHGTVYYHFSDKRAVLLAVLGEFFAQVQTMLAAWAVTSDTGPEAAERFGHAVARLLHDNRDVALILRNESHSQDPQIRGVIQGAFAAVLQHIERALQHGIELGSVRPLDVRIAALAQLGMLKEVVLGLLDQPGEVDLEHVLAEIAQLQNHGIRPSREEER